jgi:hypothetical protein
MDNPNDYDDNDDGDDNYDDDDDIKHTSQLGSVNFSSSAYSIDDLNTVAGF